ncbi:MAG: zinc ribbon domain-containing protein [Ruminococcus sp.]|nr:zinc ribbon domain-containing protein [Ruminococcus sp.]
MICPNCGKQLPDGVPFCSYCGKPVAQFSDQPVNQNIQQLYPPQGQYQPYPSQGQQPYGYPPQQPYPYPPQGQAAAKKSNTKLIIIIAIIAVLVIGGVITAVLLINKNKEEKASSSMSEYDKKSRLKTLNGDAKTVFNSVAVYVTDMEVMGTPLDYNDMSATYTFDGRHASGADPEIVKCIEEALYDGREDIGDCEIRVGAAEFNGRLSYFIQVRDKNGIIGQYPEAIKSIEDSDRVNFGTFYGDD